MKKIIVLLVILFSFFGLSVNVFAGKFDGAVEKIVMKREESQRINYIERIKVVIVAYKKKLQRQKRLSEKQKKILSVLPELEKSIEVVKKQLEKKQLEKKQLEKKQLERKQLEKKQLEKKQLEKKQLEKKQLEKKQLEKKQLEKKNISQSHNSQTSQKSQKSEQYTPNQANWSTFQSKPMAVSSVVSHDPDGIKWLSKESWEKAKWDGKTIYDPTKMSKQEFARAICPSGDQIRGIREVFYKHKPFADNKNPTKAEVDEWHRIAINHVRALVGYTQPERQVQKDHCTTARALWGDEFKYTKKWDKYIGQPGAKCDKKKAHCGFGFLPNAEDQKPYLPKGHQTCRNRSGAEGVFSASKSNIPWSIKWSRSLCATLGQEGFWGGHTGPWFHRQKFGFSFWDLDPKNNNNNTVLRAKWSGKLMPSLYKKP